MPLNHKVGSEFLTTWETQSWIWLLTFSFLSLASSIAIGIPFQMETGNS